jgi:hypothetical protein
MEDWKKGRGGGSHMTKCRELKWKNRNIGSTGEQDHDALHGANPLNRLKIVHN